MPSLKRNRDSRPEWNKVWMGCFRPRRPKSWASLGNYDRVMAWNKGSRDAGALEPSRVTAKRSLEAPRERNEETGDPAFS